MITEHDLQEAIAECQGKLNPNANTCMMLASFLTIKDHMFPEEEKPQYSYDAEPRTVSVDTIGYISESDFGRAVNGKNVEDVMVLMDEVMDVVQVINPRLYNSIMDRI